MSIVNLILLEGVEIYTLIIEKFICIRIDSTEDYVGNLY